jgi:hypothetical protein
MLMNARRMETNEQWSPKIFYVYFHAGYIHFFVGIRHIIFLSFRQL